MCTAKCIGVNFGCTLNIEQRTKRLEKNGQHIHTQKIGLQIDILLREIKYRHLLPRSYWAK